MLVVVYTISYTTMPTTSIVVLDSEITEPGAEKSAKEVREEGLDKFYTLPETVDKCMASLGELYDWKTWDLIVEPGAGNGSFYTKIPRRCKIGMDICPEHPDIEKANFFHYWPEKRRKNILVLGNPPFGKVSSLAIKFFNHATTWCEVIAFIVPRTFRKHSVQNKLNPRFCLVFDEDIPTTPCSFSPPIAAKCCFQVWEKCETAREIVRLPTKHDDWTFLPYGPLDETGQPTPPESADFTVRAYGGKCGDIRTSDLDALRPKSWHWIKSNIDKELLIKRFGELDYAASENTARQNSIGRAEFVLLYTEYMESHVDA